MEIQRGVSMKVIIVGAGKLGYKLAQAMINSDIDVTMIDTNPKVLERINDHLDVLTINANGVQVEVLSELNVKSYDLLIAVTSSDETNIIICSFAKKLGCPSTVARIRNPEYAQQLEFIKAEMGIDYVVNPEMATANEMARYLLKSYAFYSGDYAKGKVCMVDFHVGNLKDFTGKRIMDIRDMDGLLITAISRAGDILIPNGGTILTENDMIYVIGKKENINSLADRCKISQEKRSIKKAMILGGGKIGFYLAEKLIQQGIKVKIVEQDRERCKYLSEKLSSALVIYGDGTDINLLEEEDMASMDAFISATGYDEENLLMAVTAKQSGVQKVIAKVSRAGYVPIIDKLGIDVALNPVNITASEILKFIRGGRVVSVSLLMGGQAEVTEIIATDNKAVIEKPLSELNLPKSIIIGAIVHQGKVIIPNGKSVIYPNDRLVIFSLLSDVPNLEAFFKPNKGGLFSELWNSGKGIRKPSNDRSSRNDA